MLAKLSDSLRFIWIYLIVFKLPAIFGMVFDEMSGLHVWITVSSLVSKTPSRGLMFRQIELNWINAPLRDDSDYIALYLDSQADGQALPVSVYKISGQKSGQIMTDYYLPQIDFYNETLNFLRQQDQQGYKPTWRSEPQLAAGASGSSSRYHQYFPKSKLEILYTDALIRDDKQASSSLGPTMPLRYHEDWDPFGQQASSMFSPMSGSSATQSINRETGARNAKVVFNDQCVGYCLAYHTRGSKILAKNCLKTNPNWMLDSYQAIASKSMPWIMIPGTHNSGTYPRQLDKSMLQIINKYQMNQDENIFNQLIYGIRHLDLRIGYSKVKQRSETLWIYHDIFRTDLSLNEVLEQVKLFLDLTSHEVIIMDFHRFTVGFENENAATQLDRHAKMIELLFSQLGNYIVPCYGGQHDPIRELVATGRRLVIGYASRTKLLKGLREAEQMRLMSPPSATASNQSKDDKTLKPVRDIDAAKQDIEDSMDIIVPNRTSFGDSMYHQDQTDRRVGTRLFNKLKSLKLISRSFSKRSTGRHIEPAPPGRRQDAIHRPQESQQLERQQQAGGHGDILTASLSRANLFCPPVVHMWPNKDALDGFAQYLNETTCRRYLGDLRSMMAELTPTVFGVIADKYDGNRRLAQTVNRQVTDWIRDRWMHCLNIVASDYFLGNDLIRLAIVANRMRSLDSLKIDFNSYGNCKSFRQVEHLLDKSRVPLQFIFHDPKFPSLTEHQLNNLPQQARNMNESDYITHTSSDGRQLHLKPLKPGFSVFLSDRDKRESFVDNVSDSITNIFSSLKKLLNM